ncbi:MAG TPA: energy transducer TonB [Croceibacterium sp.]|nr:energy transducer TonB [Croceibacterium sp.]
MRLFNLIAGALLLCLALPSAAGAKAVVLQPQSAWALDSDDESCALVRVFGDGEGVIQLELRQFSPGGTMQVQVVSNERHVSNRDHMSYRFEPETEWREKNRMSFGYFGVPRKFEGVVFDASLLPEKEKDDKSTTPPPPSDPKTLQQIGAALNTIDGVSLTDAFSDELTLHTGSLMQPFTALRQCLDKVVEKWGFDPFVQSTLTKVPKPVNIKDVAAATQRAYPGRQLMEGMPAIIQVRLSVDAAGKTTGCSVHGPLSDEAFHKAACKNLTAMQFEPALDAKGQAVASFWETRVYYVVN